MLYVLQFLASYTISSFAKIPTLHGWRNQNVGGFSHTRNDVTMSDSPSSTSDSFFERPSEVNATEFELRLGSFKINPFESGKLNGSRLFATHVCIFKCCHETDRLSSNPISLISLSLLPFSSHFFPFSYYFAKLFDSSTTSSQGRDLI